MCVGRGRLCTRMCVGVGGHGLLEYIYSSSPWGGGGGGGCMEDEESIYSSRPWGGGGSPKEQF